MNNKDNAHFKFMRPFTRNFVVDWLLEALKIVWNIFFDGDYAGDDADDDYGGDANCDYYQGYECWVN